MSNSRESRMRIFVGRRVRITHDEGSIHLTQNVVCQDVRAVPQGQEENFELQLDSGSFMGIVPDIFGENFVEGVIHKAKGRRRIEIIE